MMAIRIVSSMVPATVRSSARRKMALSSSLRFCMAWEYLLFAFGTVYHASMRTRQRVLRFPRAMRGRRTQRSYALCGRILRWCGCVTSCYLVSHHLSPHMLSYCAHVALIVLYTPAGLSCRDIALGPISRATFSMCPGTLCHADTRTSVLLCSLS